MTILKKGQIALLSVTFMLVIAGYINYKYNPDREKNLGQTIYVNNKDGYTYDNVSIYDDKEKTKTDALKDETQVNSSIDTSKAEDSIAVFKYDRDNMFSELSENYREIIANSNTSKEKINEYQAKLNDLISKKNLITMVENVIKAKGIEDIVIIPTNNDKLNIVVKSKEDLKPEQIAQIQQVLQDQFNISADKISLSVKK